MIEFQNVAVKMREVWAGDRNDDDAIDLMGRFAVQDGSPITPEQFRVHVGELSPLDYLALWQSFKRATLTPKAN
jgi:hypothetical protein